MECLIVLIKRLNFSTVFENMIRFCPHREDVISCAVSLSSIAMCESEQLYNNIGPVIRKNQSLPLKDQACDRFGVISSFEKKSYQDLDMSSI